MNNGQVKAQRLINSIPAINVVHPTRVGEESRRFMNNTANFLKNNNVSENVKLNTMKMLLDPKFGLDTTLNLNFPEEGIYYRLIRIVMDARKNGWAQNVPRLINYITKTAKARLLKNGQRFYLGASNRFRSHILNSGLFTHNEIMKLIPGIREDNLVPYGSKSRQIPSNRFRTHIFRNEHQRKVDKIIRRNLEAVRKKRMKEIANNAAEAMRRKKREKVTSTALLSTKNLPTNVKRQIIGRVHNNLNNYFG